MAIFIAAGSNSSGLSNCVATLPSMRNSLRADAAEVGAVQRPVAKLAGAELAPRVALEPLAMVRAHGGRAQPKVPLQLCGDGLLALGRLAPVGPAAAVPHVDLPDFAQRAVLDQLDRAAERPAVRPLIAHRDGFATQRTAATEEWRYGLPVARRIL
jgi:hypothetical protein